MSTHMKICLTKEDTLLLKGLAITAIVLHNIYHNYIGSITENEFEFHPESFNSFWRLFLHPDISIFNNFFSFYGHYGVPLFFFFSGYGLTKKYQNIYIDTNFFCFIKEHIKKLWLLFVPLLLLFIIIFSLKSFYNHEILDAINKIGHVLLHAFYRITFIGNFIPGEAEWLFGPWWFFSAILQLYIIYWLFLRKASSPTLASIGVVCILFQIIIYWENPIWLALIRHNFPAWLPALILGILWARSDKREIPVAIVCFLVALCFAADGNFYSWLLFSPLFFLPFLLASSIIKKGKRLKSIFVWLGKQSASLFAVNGFVRLYIISPVFSTEKLYNPAYLFLIGLFSLGGCICFTVLYSRLLKFIRNYIE